MLILRVLRRSPWRAEDRITGKGGSPPSNGAIAKDNLLRRCGQRLRDPHALHVLPPPFLLDFTGEPFGQSFERGFNEVAPNRNILPQQMRTVVHK